MTNDGLALCKWPSAYRTTNFHFRRDVRPLSSTIAHFLLLNGFRSTGFIGNWKSYYRCDLRDARRIHARFVPRDPSFSFFSFFFFFFHSSCLILDRLMKLSLVEKKKENFLSVIRRLYKRNSSSSSLESKNFAIIQALDGFVFPVKVFILPSFWKEVEKSRPSLENIIISNSIPWSLIIGTDDIRQSFQVDSIRFFDRQSNFNSPHLSFHDRDILASEYRTRQID